MFISNSNSLVTEVVEENVERPEHVQWRELVKAMKQYLTAHRQRAQEALRQARERAETFTPYKPKKRSYSRTKVGIFMKWQRPHDPDHHYQH